MSEHYDDYLAHYGVKGMKWGVVHEREYEGSGRRRAKNQNGSGLTEKQKRNILAGVGIGAAGVGLALGGRKLIRMKNLKTAKKVLSTKSGAKAKTELKNKVTSEAKKNTVPKIEQKVKPVKTETKNAEVFKAEQKVKPIKTETKVNVSAEEKKILEKYDVTKKEAPHLNDMSVLSSEVKKINAGNTGPASDVNCARCSFAFELRARGYDVKAPNIPADKREEELLALYKDPVIMKKEAFASSEKLNEIESLEKAFYDANDEILEAQDGAWECAKKIVETDKSLFEELFVEDIWYDTEGILEIAEKNEAKIPKSLITDLKNARTKREELGNKLADLNDSIEELRDSTALEINKNFVKRLKEPDVFPPGSRGHLMITKPDMFYGGHSVVVYNKPNEGILVIDTQQDYMAKIEDFFGLNSEGIFTATTGKDGYEITSKWELMSFHRTDNLEFNNFEDVISDILRIPTKSEAELQDDIRKTMKELGLI